MREIEVLELILSRFLDIIESGPASAQDSEILDSYEKRRWAKPVLENADINEIVQEIEHWHQTHDHSIPVPKEFLFPGVEIPTGQKSLGRPAELKNSAFQSVSLWRVCEHMQIIALRVVQEDEVRLAVFMGVDRMRLDRMQLGSSRLNVEDDTYRFFDQDGYVIEIETTMYPSLFKDPAMRTKSVRTSGI